MRITALIAASLSVLALGLAAGCGGDDGGSSGASATDDWANDVCSAVTDWTSAMTSVGSSLQGGNISQDSLEEALDNVRDATDQFADDIRGLGRPDTEAGEEAKQTLDGLADDLEKGRDEIDDAVQGADTAPELAAAAPTVTQTLTAMSSDVATAFSSLQQLDAEGELGGRVLAGPVLRRAREPELVTASDYEATGRLHRRRLGRGAVRMLVGDVFLVVDALRVHRPDVVVRAEDGFSTARIAVSIEWSELL